MINGTDEQVDVVGGNGAEQQPQPQVAEPQPPPDMDSEPTETRLAGQQNQQQFVAEKVTRSYVVNRPVTGVPMPGSAPGMMRRDTTGTPKYKADRDYIADLTTEPISVNLKFHVRRIEPLFDAEGRRFPPDQLLQTEVMELDEIRNAVSKAWGGGKYRVSIHDGTTGELLEGPKWRVVTFYVPIEGNLPRFLPDKGAAATAVEDDPDTADIDRARKQIDAETKRQKAEIMRLEQASKRARLELELKRATEQLTGPASSGDDKIAAMLTAMQKANEEAIRRVEDDRKTAEARAKEEREREEQRRRDEREREERLRKEEKEEARRQQESSEKRAADHMTLMMTLVTKMTEKPVTSGPSEAVAMMTALAPILAPKTDGVNQSAQLIADIQKAGMDTQMKIAEMGMRSSRRDEATMNAERQMLLQAALNSKDNMGSLREQLKLLGDLKDLTDDRGPTEDGYDPAIGFGGNLMKSIAGGLSSLIKAAAENPQLITLVMQLFGRRNPTQRDVEAAARRMAQQQQPLLTQPTQQGPGPAPRLMMFPTPPQTQQAPVPQTQPQVTGAPASPPPIPGGPATTVQQQQVDAATELEGESTGMPTDETDPSETTEGRLRIYVTDAIEECINDIKDKREAREWWLYAKEYWNGDFLKTIIDAPSDGERVERIQNVCRPEVWAQLAGLLNGDTTGVELTKFYQGLHALVDAVKNPPAEAKPVEGAVVNVATGPTVTTPVAPVAITSSQVSEAVITQSAAAPGPSAVVTPLQASL